MVVLLVGDSNFTEFELVEQAVEEGGADVVMCDTCDWPDGPPVEFSPSKDSFTIGDGVDIDDVTGIFSMYQTVFQELHTEYIDWYDGENSFPRSINQFREWRSFFQSLIRVCDERDATVVPTKEVYNRYFPIGVSSGAKSVV